MEYLFWFSLIFVNYFVVSSGGNELDSLSSINSAVEADMAEVFAHEDSVVGYDSLFQQLLENGETIYYRADEKYPIFHRATNDTGKKYIVLKQTETHLGTNDNKTKIVLRQKERNARIYTVHMAVISNSKDIVWDAVVLEQRKEDEDLISDLIKNHPSANNGLSGAACAWIGNIILCSGANELSPVYRIDHTPLFKEIQFENGRKTEEEDSYDNSLDPTQVNSKTENKKTPKLDSTDSESNYAPSVKDSHSNNNSNLKKREVNNADALSPLKQGLSVDNTDASSNEAESPSVPNVVAISKQESATSLPSNNVNASKTDRNVKSDVAAGVSTVTGKPNNPSTINPKAATEETAKTTTTSSPIVVTAPVSELDATKIRSRHHPYTSLTLRDQQLLENHLQKQSFQNNELENPDSMDYYEMNVRDDVGDDDGSPQDYNDYDLDMYETPRNKQMLNIKSSWKPSGRNRQIAPRPSTYSETQPYAIPTSTYFRNRPYAIPLSPYSINQPDASLPSTYTEDQHYDIPKSTYSESRPYATPPSTYVEHRPFAAPPTTYLNHRPFATPPTYSRKRFIANRPWTFSESRPSGIPAPVDEPRQPYYVSPSTYPESRPDPIPSPAYSRKRSIANRPSSYSIRRPSDNMQSTNTQSQPYDFLPYTYSKSRPDPIPSPAYSRKRSLPNRPSKYSESRSNDLLGPPYTKGQPYDVSSPTNSARRPFGLPGPLYTKQQPYDVSAPMYPQSAFRHSTYPKSPSVPIRSRPVTRSNYFDALPFEKVRSLKNPAFDYYATHQGQRNSKGATEYQIQNNEPLASDYYSY